MTLRDMDGRDAKGDGHGQRVEEVPECWWSVAALGKAEDEPELDWEELLGSKLGAGRMLVS